MVRIHLPPAVSLVRTSLPRSGRQNCEARRPARWPRYGEAFVTPTLPGRDARPETKLILPAPDHPSHSAKRDPALIKAIARGRAWFEELATGRARRFRGFVRVGVDHRPTGHPG